MSFINFENFSTAARALKNTYREFLREAPNADYAVLTEGVQEGVIGTNLVTAEDDIINPLATNTYLFTADGNDTVTEAASGSLAAILDDGDDSFIGNDANTVAATVFGGNGDDQFVSTGDALFGEEGDDQFISTGFWNDTLDGGSGDDYFEAGAGSDLVEGDSGNDTITAGHGDDSVDGGTGDDVIYGGNGAVDAADGNDLLIGGRGEDIIFGNSGDDTLFGGEDIRDTKDGDDILFGGLGNDTIYGNSGDDILVGANGDDQMYGGIGDDTINLGAFSGNDTVYGFEGAGESGGDLLHLITNLNNSGITDFDSFIAAGSAQGNDTLFDLGAGNTLLVKNTQLDDFGADDVLFTNSFADSFGDIL